MSSFVLIVAGLLGAYYWPWRKNKQQRREEERRDFARHIIGAMEVQWKEQHFCELEQREREIERQLAGRRNQERRLTLAQQRVKELEQERELEMHRAIILERLRAIEQQQRAREQKQQRAREQKQQRAKEQQQQRARELQQQRDWELQQNRARESEHPRSPEMEEFLKRPLHGEECPICLETLQAEYRPHQLEVIMLSCGHVFHEVCVESWLEDNKINSKQCPVCRAEARDPVNVTDRCLNGCLPKKNRKRRRQRQRTLYS